MSNVPADIVERLAAVIRRRGLALDIQLIAGGRVRARASKAGMSTSTDHLVGEGYGDDLHEGLDALVRDLDRQGL